MTSLRYGPHPSDLPLADPSGREYRTSRAIADFAVVRFRRGGVWQLGVLRAWRQSAAGTIVRIEAAASDGRVELLWYVFRAESIDPLAVSPHSGEVRLVPPHTRTAPQQ